MSGKIELFKVFMHSDVHLDEVLHSGFISQGTAVDEFENKLVDYIGNKRCLTVNSGTSALVLALKLLEKTSDVWPGFGPEDVVLTPALTCFATTSAILSNNYALQWIDVDRYTANVSLDDIGKKLSAKTKIVVVVHWGGYPVDLDKLREMQDEHEKMYGYRFMVIEDCAHAFGSTYNGLKLGNHGNICAFSFQAIKHLTCGDGVFWFYQTIPCTSEQSYFVGLESIEISVISSKRTSDWKIILLNQVASTI